MECLVVTVLILVFQSTGAFETPSFRLQGNGRDDPKETVYGVVKEEEAKNGTAATQLPNINMSSTLPPALLSTSTVLPLETNEEEGVSRPQHNQTVVIIENHTSSNQQMTSPPTTSAQTTILPQRPSNSSPTHVISTSTERPNATSNQTTTKVPQLQNHTTPIPITTTPSAATIVSLSLPALFVSLISTIKIH